MFIQEETQAVSVVVKLLFDVVDNVRHGALCAFPLSEAVLALLYWLGQDILIQLPDHQPLQWFKGKVREFRQKDHF